jgi:hypothetical protein
MTATRLVPVLAQSTLSRIGSGWRCGTRNTSRCLPNHWLYYRNNFASIPLFKRFSLILPLNVAIQTPLERINRSVPFGSLVIPKVTLASVNVALGIHIAIRTHGMTVGCVLVYFTLVILVETKANVVGTTTIGDDKVISWSSLAAIEVAPWRLSFTDTSGSLTFFDTFGTEHSIRKEINTILPAFTRDLSRWTFTGSGSLGRNDRK